MLSTFESFVCCQLFDQTYSTFKSFVRRQLFDVAIIQVDKYFLNVFIYSIAAVFWQEWVDCVEVDKTYIFKNLRVKKNNYTKEIYANTAKEGFHYQETDAFLELAETEPTMMEMTTKDTTISIIGIKTVSCYHPCNACGKTTKLTGKLLKCGSCKLKQRITPESKHWFVRLFVKDTTNFTCLSLTSSW